MIDKSKLKELLLGEIEKRHKLGEQVGGSGHLGYVSLTNLEIGEPAEIEYNGEKTFEIPFTFAFINDIAFRISGWFNGILPHFPTKLDFSFDSLADT